MKAREKSGYVAPSISITLFDQSDFITTSAYEFLLEGYGNEIDW